MHTEVKNSRLNLFYLLGSFILFALGVMAFLGFVQGSSTFRDNKISSIFVMFLACTIIPWSWSLKVSVNKNRLLTQSIIGKKVTLFKNVHSLKVSGNNYGGFNITLRQHDAGNHLVPVSFFFNQKELIKAALEATQYANPDATFEGYAADFIHQPPYDVLKLEKAEKTRINKFYKS